MQRGITYTSLHFPTVIPYTYRCHLHHPSCLRSPCHSERRAKPAVKNLARARWYSHYKANVNARSQRDGRGLRGRTADKRGS